MIPRLRDAQASGFHHRGPPRHDFQLGHVLDLVRLAELVVGVHPLGGFQVGVVGLVLILQMLPGIHSGHSRVNLYDKLFIVNIKYTHIYIYI